MYIQHLHHSGFLIRHGKFLLLFDVVEGFDLPATEGLELVFFSSHGHKDHYSESLAKELSPFHTTYILSSHCTKTPPNPDVTCIMEPDQEVTLGPLTVRTFGSTDQGVSFYVELLGKRYFHSGDLNWWHWERMSPEELSQEEAAFKRELEKISALSIDFAFVPVDPRLKEHGVLAANAFAKTVHPKYLIPMHNFGDYRYFEDLEERLELGETRLIPVKEKGQKIWEEQDL